MQVAILGAGMVGRTIAADLVKRHAVTSFDINEGNLQVLADKSPQVNVRKVDLQEYGNYSSWLSPYDYVVTAVPGYMGFACLQAVIHARKSAADISFFPENALHLDSLAKEKGVTVITDAGVAPGMSNYIIGNADKKMSISRFECYVGGLPKSPTPPFYYKAPFSPVDVIEEYTRPARLMEQGKVVVKEALTDRSQTEYDGIGVLEAFNTDGLRSLLHTMSHIPDMKEQTLRYPGHLDLIISLRDAGFFSTTPVSLKKVTLRPIDLTTRLLIDQWKMGPTDEDITVMKVLITGIDKGVPVEMVYILLDYYDIKSGFSSMSRTTGFTCSASLELIMQGLFTSHGVFPPECVGSDEACFCFVLDYLAQRGVNWVQHRKETAAT